jgi:hypothetical protein
MKSTTPKAARLIVLGMPLLCSIRYVCLLAAFEEQSEMEPFKLSFVLLFLASQPLFLELPYSMLIVCA